MLLSCSVMSDSLWPPWTAACRVFLSFTVSQSLLKFMSIESVMSSNHLIFCCPLLLLPSIFPSIRVFSNESTLHIRWPKEWRFSFSISPFNEYSGLDGTWKMETIWSCALVGTSFLLFLRRRKGVGYRLPSTWHTWEPRCPPHPTSVSQTHGPVHSWDSSGHQN